MRPTSDPVLGSTDRLQAYLAPLRFLANGTTLHPHPYSRTICQFGAQILRRRTAWPDIPTPFVGSVKKVGQRVRSFRQLDDLVRQGTGSVYDVPAEVGESQGGDIRIAGLE